MFEINAHVRIARPRRHALRLAKQSEQRVSAHHEEQLMPMNLLDATCELRPLDEHVDIQVLSASRRALAPCPDVLVRHRKPMADGEHFVVDWSDENTGATFDSVSEGHAS